MKFFQCLVNPTNFKINKGNIKLTSEEADYCIKYPDSMDGSVEINQINENINIELKQDFPSEDPVIINLKNLSECNVHLNNGVINSEFICPIMRIKVDNGSVSAKLSKYTTGLVKAHVNIGILNNTSDLTKVQNDNPQNTFFGMNFMNMNTGLNNNIELMGTLDYCTAIFEIGAGTMDLS